MPRFRLNAIRPLRTRFLAPVAGALVLGGALVAARPARAGVTWVGEKAPELSFEKYLNAPAGTPVDLAGFRGRAVVIEFFSINCPKCQAAMPHYNELARSMRDRPVTFISLTNEPEADVRAFLASTPMSAFVALDPDWSMWRDYFVAGIPLAVVINPKGVIAALTHPESLTPAAIEDAIAGRTPALRRSALLDDTSAPADRANKALPFMLVDVKPAPADSPYVLWKADEIRAQGATLADLLGVVLNIEPHLFVSDDLLLDARYDVAISPPDKDPAMADALLRAVVEQMAHPRLRKEMRSMPVYVLGSRPVDAMSIKPGGDETPSLRGGRGKVVATNVTIAQLVANLQRELHATVIDETGLSGGYSFSLEWDPDDPGALAQALRRQAGFEVRLERRPIEVYVVKRGE